MTNERAINVMARTGRRLFSLLNKLDGPAATELDGILSDLDSETLAMIDAEDNMALIKIGGTA
jgi:hypothetical protein